MNTKRVTRMLQLVQALESGRPCTAEDLARSLGLSRRTVFRDLEVLTKAGIPYHYDRDSRSYWTERSRLLPPVSFTQAEVFSLMLASRLLLSDRFTPDAPAAVSAVQKMEAMLPEPIRAYCGELLQRTAFRHGPASPSDSVRDLVSSLQSAAVRRHKVAMRYDSYYERAVIQSTLHPYRVVYFPRGWYVIGRSEAHGGVRTFKLERILELRPTAERFEPATEFNLEEYLGNAWMMIRGTPAAHVRIRFSPMVAGNVDEVAWHRTQRTEFLEDGSLLFEVDVDGLHEIAWWILGYGDQAEVLDPPELRSIIAERVRGMALFYAGDAAEEAVPKARRA